MIASGIYVLRIGCGPTPMIYFSEFFLKSNASIMITGSHNPSIYNGFKISLKGCSLFGKDIKKLGMIAESGLFITGNGKVQSIVIFSAYIKYILKDFFFYYSGGKYLKIVWDCGNGSTYKIIEELVKRLPGKHLVLNEKNYRKNSLDYLDPAIAKDLYPLISAVLLNNYDFGIAFDADGDRIGIVDEVGSIIWGDQLLILYSEEILRKYPNSFIVTDVKASKIVFDEIIRLGGNPFMFRTGHSLIKSKMKEINAFLGGEMSGHFFFRDRHMGFDDGIYAALRLIGFVSLWNKTLKNWRESLPEIINTPEIRFDYPDECKFILVKEIENSIRDSGVNYSNIDGIRVNYKDGWWLLRASNTQSAIVIRLEANDQKSFKRLKLELTKELIKNGVEIYI